MELSSPEAIEMAVERGVGIAFVSEMVAARVARFRSRERKWNYRDLIWNEPYTCHGTCIIPLREHRPYSGILRNHSERKLNTEIWDSLVSFKEIVKLAQ
jgi:hypothetical protein